jgi:hypothetical protein
MNNIKFLVITKERFVGYTKQLLSYQQMVVQKLDYLIDIDYYNSIKNTKNLRTGFPVLGNFNHTQIYHGNVTGGWIYYNYKVQVVLPADYNMVEELLKIENQFVYKGATTRQLINNCLIIGDFGLELEVESGMSISDVMQNFTPRKLFYKSKQVNLLSVFR